VRTARALWAVAPGRAEIREEALPVPGPDQVLVRALASGVSRGTERLVLQGRVPPSQWEAMRAPLMAGAFPFPVKYGYAAVGVVESGAPELRNHRVFCLHPHQDLFVAPAAMCVALPDAVPVRRAVLAANMETAVNILWDARPLVGERAVVIGAGVVGLLAGALLARVPGLDLLICDRDPLRAGAAGALGLRFCAPEEAPGGRDLVVHASGNPDGLRLALGLAGFEGRIVEASWFGDSEAALPLGEAFHARRLSLVSSQVGAVAAAMRGRRTHAERLALALRLLEDARFDGLLGPATPFADLPAALPALLSADGGGNCSVVTYP
jgi:threonine dehydrogenase-like Zn-dependent dehydrogenase